MEQNSCVDMSSKGVWIGPAIILKSSNELIGDCALKIDGQYKRGWPHDKHLSQTTLFELMLRTWTTSCHPCRPCHLA
ncbi:MAG: hypothetical protein RR066_08045 [Mucinivorans sp.]